MWIQRQLMFYMFQFPQLYVFIFYAEHPLSRWRIYIHKKNASIYYFNVDYLFCEQMTANRGIRKNVPVNKIYEQLYRLWMRVCSKKNVFDNIFHGPWVKQTFVFGWSIPKSVTITKWFLLHAGLSWYVLTISFISVFSLYSVIVFLIMLPFSTRNIFLLFFSYLFAMLFDVFFFYAF